MDNQTFKKIGQKSKQKKLINAVLTKAKGKGKIPKAMMEKIITNVNLEEHHSIEIIRDVETFAANLKLVDFKKETHSYEKEIVFKGKNIYGNIGFGKKKNHLFLTPEKKKNNETKVVSPEFSISEPAAVIIEEFTVRKKKENKEKKHIEKDNTLLIYLPDTINKGLYSKLKETKQKEKTYQ